MNLVINIDNVIVILSHDEYCKMNVVLYCLI